MSDTNSNIDSQKKTAKEAGSCNTKEHKEWNRRSFLQALGLVGGGSMMFANTALSVSQPSPLSAALSDGENDNILIICRFSGGNDGFNTVIPVYDYDVYANARPIIKIPPSEFINLEQDQFAMPKSLNKLENLWGDGQMKVVHGVGYENPSLSHFQGSDIWANTDPDNFRNRSGFMGRYFQDIYPDYAMNPPSCPPSIQIGSVGNLIFRGPGNDFSFAVSNPERLLQIAEDGTSYNLDMLPDCTYGDRVRFMREMTNTTFNYSDEISSAYARSTDFGTYLDDSLGRQFNIISRLIKGNLGTRVYMVTLGGFDTHSNQIQRHDELFRSFSEAVSTFYADLTAAGWDDKVLTMTISEFGRRFNENGSEGTDHGTAAPMLFFGTGLQGNGFVGEHPDLNTLTRGGNVTNTNDFRQVYATVMRDWMCVDEDVIQTAIPGEPMESLDLGFNCTGGGSLQNNGEEIAHVVTYDENNQPFLNINTPSMTHVDICLYNIIGQKIATLRNEMLNRGNHVIDIRQAANTTLSTGQYVYQIQSNIGNYSKSVIIS